MRTTRARLGHVAFLLGLAGAFSMASACGPAFIDTAYQPLRIVLVGPDVPDGSDADPFRNVARLVIRLHVFEDELGQLPYGSSLSPDDVVVPVTREVQGAPRTVTFDGPVTLPRLSDGQAAFYVRAEIEGLDSSGAQAGRAECPIVKLDRGGDAVECSAWFGAVNRWTPLPASPNGGRRSFAAATLPDGRVILAGGRTLDSSATPLDTIELFDPLTGEWSLLESTLGQARYGLTATVTEDGLVVFAGGRTGPGPDELSSAVDIFDPIGDMLSTQSTALAAPRAEHAAASLGGRAVLVAGGVGLSNVSSPAGETFAPGDPLAVTTGVHGERWQPCVAPAGPGRAVVCGGGVSTPEGGATDSCVLFDQSSLSFTDSGSLTTGRRGARCVGVGGRVYIVGGSNHDLHGRKIEVWDNGFVVTLDTIPEALEGHAMVVSGAHVVIAGGHPPGVPGSPSRLAMAIDTAKSDELITLPSLSVPRAGAQLVPLSGSRVMLVGGYSGASGQDPGPLMLLLPE